MLHALAPLEELVPSATPARISFLVVDARGVVEVDDHGRTVVAVWPTDGAGRVDAAAVRAGGVELLLWRLPVAVAAQLCDRDFRRAWPVVDCDFRVSGRPGDVLLVPLLTSLRALSAELGLDLAARVATARRLLAA